MNTVLSIMMLAALALVVGSVFLWRRGGAKKQISLMLILAAVMVVNVLIWTVPDKNGEAPVNALNKADALAK